MKRRYIAIVLGVMMTVSAVASTAVFAEENTAVELSTENADENAEGESAEENVIYGEVTAVEDGTITVDVGTLDEGSAPGEESIEKTGETQEIKITDETQISRGGGHGGEAPEKPDGEAPDGEAPDGEAPDGETPDGETPEKPDGEAPDGEAPDGETPDGETPDGEAPEKPDGEAPEKPDGEAPDGASGATQQTLTLDDVQVGDIVAITLNDDGTAAAITLQNGSNGPGGMGMPGGNGGPGGSSSEVIYEGSTEITSAAEESGQTYTSDSADQSALYISTADNVSISDATVTKTGDSDGGDNCNFYGQNAAVLVKDGAMATISGASITSDANGANGVFSYGGNAGQNGAEGDGTTVMISDSSITTTGDGAGGIMTAGGGITNASNLTVETSGRSSAAIRSDRGGGTVSVDGGTYTTNGLGSPAIYSTADITVSNATLQSNLSEGVCIEGLNSIELNDCDLTANNTDLNGNATFNDTIMIYQSMSGDSANGTSSFTMNGGSLISENGHVFHVTNTDAIITLDGVQIMNEDENNVLISVCNDGWNGGSNIADLNASNQTLDGAVLVGDNSTLTMNLSDNSSFTGYVGGEIENAKGEKVSSEVGTVSVTLDETATWTLTDDSYVTEFNGDASNIISNGYTLYVNGEALEGTK